MRPFGSVHTVFVICVCASTYDRLSSENVSSRDSVYDCTFIRNVQVRDSMHAHNLSINIHAHSYMSIRARASTIILDRNSVHMFVGARTSASIRARGGCSIYLFVGLSKNYMDLF